MDVSWYFLWWRSSPVLSLGTTTSEQRYFHDLHRLRPGTLTGANTHRFNITAIYVYRCMYVCVSEWFYIWPLNSPLSARGTVGSSTVPQCHRNCLNLEHQQVKVSLSVFRKPYDRNPEKVRHVLRLWLRSFQQNPGCPGTEHVWRSDQRRRRHWLKDPGSSERHPRLEHSGVTQRHTDTTSGLELLPEEPSRPRPLVCSLASAAVTSADAAPPSLSSLLGLVCAECALVAAAVTSGTSPCTYVTWYFNFFQQ